jgi:hypothetical protein
MDQQVRGHKKNDGAYERARDQWICAVVYVSRRMGRHAARALQVAYVLLLHTNRGEFNRRGWLVAFPSLPRLASMTGIAEMTVRRAIEDLGRAGLVQVKQRFEDTSLYYLTIPPEAVKHSARCVEMLSNPRHRGNSQVLGGWSHLEAKRPPSEQLHSDYTLTEHSIPKGRDLASRHLSEDQKEKRVGEEEKYRGEPQAPSMAENFRDAREMNAASVVGRAVAEWDRSAEEIREAIDSVREYGGNASDLAHELWRPD